MSKTLAIISHTEHYMSKNNQVYGWGPTVREVNNLTHIFSKIIHIAPLYPSSPPQSSLPYQSSKIKFVKLKVAGGNGLLNKLDILLKMPHNLLIIHRVCKSVDWVQFRAPTNLGIYVLPYLKFRKSKRQWVKYAGNWIEAHSPLSYRLQKFLLNNNFQKSKVTINGRWAKQKSHLISFENPCLTSDELINATKSIDTKNYYSKLNVCFVGRVEDSKGVGLLIKSLIKLRNQDWLGVVYIVGDGKDLESSKQKVKNSSIKRIVFTGSLSHDELKKIYKKSHLFILPSLSEGFPKVIAESIAYGCIPITSDVSCISQYIKDNGFILKETNVSNIVEILNHINKNRNVLIEKSKNSFQLSNQFTFENYNRKLQKYIINENS